MPPVLLSDAQRRDWLRLIRSENVGPRTFIELLTRYRSAARALEALPELARRGGARQLRIAPLADIERELEQAARLGARFLCPGERGYPPRLAQIDSAPPLLAVRGADEVLMRETIAIVGSRNASSPGLRMAALLARDLAMQGFSVVSGLARGIDAAAHKASLGGGTIAVLAGGHDRLYPPENAPLLEDILRHDGAVVSEMPFGWEPRARDFPRRNRIVSGISAGVIIVEAAERSGSLITARMAGEQGREVFAVPGSPLDPRSAGANRLIRNGATLITCAADVIEAIRPIIDPQPLLPGIAEDEPLYDDPPPADLRERVCALLSPAPTRLDDLIRHCEAEAPQIRAILLELDLAGRIEWHGADRLGWRS